MKKIKVIGGGLAGCECAYQLLKRGYSVDLYEMRPSVGTPAHKTSKLCELVCSNSLKSTDVATSQGALKKEAELLDCFLLRIAKTCAVPAGGALAVDRDLFSEKAEQELLSMPNLNLVREECDEIDDWTVIAAGPLASKELTDRISVLFGEEHLHFYDAVAPIVKKDSIDMEHAFFAGRYGKGGEDYLNLPLDKEEYYAFVKELVGAEKVLLKDFEKGDVFEACMPVEVMAARGEDTLRFGPLRPVGLTDPATGRRPYAVVQLRKEDAAGNLYNLVGFQTNLKFGEQKRVFGMIPALKEAEFVRYGVMHRNTFINAPALLNSDFSLKKNGSIFFAGQISGVEGYMESIVGGLMCAINIDRKARGFESILPPVTTLTGSLMRYVSTPNQDFQPMHVSFALLPPIEGIRDKKKRKEEYGKRAVSDMERFVSDNI